MDRRNGQSQVSFDLLPSICEYREFGSEEDYQRAGLNLKLITTRNAFSTISQRFEDDDDPEVWPFLSLHTRDIKVCDDEWKPKSKPKLAKGRKVQKRRDHKVQREELWKPRLAKGWRMQKRRVKIAWAKRHRCLRSLITSFGLGMKVLSDSPLLLLKAMRNAYVSVMTRMASKCNQRMWYLAGTRLL